MEYICDLFDTHKMLLGRVTRFNPSIVAFIRRVIENKAGSLSSVYPVGLDDDCVESFRSKNSVIDGEQINKLVVGIRNTIADIADKNPGIFDKYYELRCENGAFVFDTTEPETPSERIKLDYDVPWGSPPGTIRVSHLDRIPLGLFRYIWCDDHEPCDVVLGEDIHIVTHGLWELVDGVLSKVRVKNMTGTSKSHPVHPKALSKRGPLNVSSDHGLPKMKAEKITGSNPVTYAVYHDGDYSDIFIENILAHLTDPEINPDGKRELNVVINGIPFLITKSGHYNFDDGDLVPVEK